MTTDRCISCGWRTLKPDPDRHLRCTRAVCGWREPIARRARIDASGPTNPPERSDGKSSNTERPVAETPRRGREAIKGKGEPGSRLEPFKKAAVTAPSNSVMTTAQRVQARSGAFPVRTPTPDPPLTTPELRQVMAPPPLSIRVVKPPSMTSIIAATCGALKVQTSDFYGSGRNRTVVLARMIVAALTRSMTRHSLPDIAEGMARPNHSTIITEIRRFSTLADYKCGDYCGPDPAVPVETMNKTVKALALEIAAQIGGA